MARYFLLGFKKMRKYNTTSDTTQEILHALEKLRWNNIESIEAADDLSFRSLNAVTHLTEYEDEKASRLLTTAAFLSALAGAIYAGILASSKDWPWWFHVCFLAFALLVTAGAGVVFWATIPRFNIPKSWVSEDSASLRSFLFAPSIIHSRPRAWVQAFEGGGDQNLRAEYARRQIHETYLIAQKVCLKYRWLKFGMILLLGSIIMLAMWLVSFAIALARL